MRFQHLKADLGLLGPGPGQGEDLVEPRGHDPVDQAHRLVDEASGEVVDGPCLGALPDAETTGRDPINPTTLHDLGLRERSLPPPFCIFTNCILIWT